MNRLEKDKIISKCVYYGKKFHFITDIWKNKFGAKLHVLNSNTDMLLIPKDKIINLKKSESIPVDCRMFSFMYENIREDGFCIILQKNGNGIEIEVPENCYYLSLSEKINIYKKEDNSHIELKSALNDKQGQWLTKIDEDLYIGIDETGILKMSLEDWYKNYTKKVNEKILEKTKLNTTKTTMEDIYTNSLLGILRIQIEKYGLLLSLYKYGLLGEIKVVSNYK